MRSRDDIIYSINVEDVQNVALENLGRSLTDEEIGLVEDKLGGYFNWHEAISSAIEETVDQE
jgi:hypothetical protein